MQHTKLFTSAIFLCGLLAAPATAQPSFDCAKAQSSAEELICADPALAQLDVDLSARFAAALQAASDVADAEQATNTLRATQRGWIKGRDDCWKAADQRACVEAAYVTREAELIALWMLEPTAAVVSYVCAGNPANEVTAFYFDTTPPVIRLEYGDSIRAGWSVPSGSGAKYATTFGGMFWIKGPNALFEWEQGTEMQCEATG